MINLTNAARAGSIAAATLAYIQAGVSVLPLTGKRAVISWTAYQRTRATEADARAWFQRGLLRNVGIICGDVSDNLTVIDLDGLNAVDAFRRKFPVLMNTYTVKSGSGHGLHLYYQVDKLLPTTRALAIPGGGNVELRASGTYIVAPPSLHPDTKLPYRVHNSLPVMRVRNLQIVTSWLASLNRQSSSGHTETRQAWGMRAIGLGYAATALEREIGAVQAANEGNRNNRLNLAAYSLGQLIADGMLTRGEVESALLNGALAGGQSEREALATIKSGIDAGMKNPRSRRRG